MKLLLGIFTFLLMTVNTQAQNYFTKTGNISFHSKTPMENIDGYNKSATCVLDVANSKLEFAVLVKGFQFEKALMQEHFNENYMESTKFPKAMFKGVVAGMENLDVTKNGKHKVKVSGDMTIHGVTQKVSTDGTLEVKDGKILAVSEFILAVEDYNIAIPSLVKDKIAKTVTVKVNSTLEPLKK